MGRRSKQRKDDRPSCGACGHRGLHVVRWSKYHHNGERPVFQCDHCGHTWTNGKGEPYLSHAQNFGVHIKWNR